MNAQLRILQGAQCASSRNGLTQNPVFDARPPVENLANGCWRSWRKWKGWARRPGRALQLWTGVPAMTPLCCETPALDSQPKALGGMFPVDIASRRRPRSGMYELVPTLRGKRFASEQACDLRGSAASRPRIPGDSATVSDSFGMSTGALFEAFQPSLWRMRQCTDTVFRAMSHSRSSVQEEN